MTPYYSDESVTIYHGDCREVLPVVGRPAAIVTDPPYGDTSLAWDRWPDGWVAAALATGAPQLWSFGSFRMWLDHAAEFAAAGWTYGQEVVWEKHNGSSFHADRFRRVHELAVHWYREPWSLLEVNVLTTNDATARVVRRKRRPAHTGHIEASAYRSEDGGPKLMRSVIFAASCHGHADHPTQKPLEVVEPLVRYSSSREDLVCDPFMGSGTTLVAARDSGRRAVGIEVDERYCEIAARRLSQSTMDFGGVA